MQKEKALQEPLQFPWTILPLLNRVEQTQLRAVVIGGDIYDWLQYTATKPMCTSQMCLAL